MPYLGHVRAARPGHENPVKNFPHQVNRIDRFTLGLGVFARLASEGADLRDDGVVGDALARAGAYTFRGSQAGTVEDRLVAEHAKSPSDQGTRTMARELRRTFEGLDFLAIGGGSLRPTADAARLLDLQADPASSEAHSIWRRAFHDLAITDASGTSHPYEIMLRLVGERPGIPKGLLGLALEAEDDSEAEFQRLLSLVDQNEATPAWDGLAISVARRANSVKILPAVAEQLGELVTVDGAAFISLPDPFEPRQEKRRRSAGAIRSRRRRYERNRSRGKRPTTGHQTTRSYDPDLSAVRYHAHEECLSAFDAMLEASLDRWEGDYDLVADDGSALLLVEVKTIRNDADNQVRLGLGQLLYYEHFDVHPDWPTTDVNRLLVVDGEIDAELENFLDIHQVGLAIRAPDGTWRGTPRARQQLAQFGVTL
jgi:hypothetical protein